MIYAVTGSTGNFGSLAISHLLELGVQPSSIVALARNKTKAADIEAKGVQIRIGNYDDVPSLEKAFMGVDKLLLVSGSEFGKRAQQHANVIAAAKKCGVKQVVYTSITRAQTSANPIAPEHKTTEETLTSSGVDFTILRNNWYTENYIPEIQHAAETGVIAAAVEKGRVASATRKEYAEAAARVLVGSGHENKMYELAGPVWNYPELAAAASAVLGKEVVFKTISKEDKTKALVGAGFDENLAEFFALVDESIEAGSLDIESSDLEMILGRRPLSLKSALDSLL